MVAYKKNKSGYYRASIVTGYTPDGKQKRVTVRSKILADFREKLKAAEHMQKQGYDFDSKNITVSEWAEQWLETYKKPHVRSHCAETYEINIRLHINPLIGHIKMSEVMPYMLQDVLNNQKGKSKSNTEKIMFCLRQMFKRAYLNGIIIKDISTDLILPETTEGSRRPLTTAEREAFVKVAENHRSGLWVLMMLYCGLRPEETVALKEVKP
jgi:integrase